MLMAEKLLHYAVQLVLAFSLVKLTKVKMDSIVLKLAPKYVLIGFFTWAVAIVIISFAVTKILFYWLQQRKNRF